MNAIKEDDSSFEKEDESSFEKEDESSLEHGQVQQCCVSNCCNCEDLAHICTPQGYVHEEPEDESFCEDCYAWECAECGCVCYCDL